LVDNSGDKATNAKAKDTDTKEENADRRAQQKDKDGNAVELHDWEGEDDSENPCNWSSSYKWVCREE